MNTELVIIARDLLDISMTAMSVKASDAIVCQTILILEQAKNQRENLKVGENKN